MYKWAHGQVASSDLYRNILPQLAPRHRQFPWLGTLTAEAAELSTCGPTRVRDGGPHSLPLFYSLILALLRPLGLMPHSICSIFSFSCIPLCCPSLSHKIPGWAPTCLGEKEVLTQVTQRSAGEATCGPVSLVEPSDPDGSPQSKRTSYKLSVI